MKDIERYRHELKYPISYIQYLAIRQRLCTIMLPDPHATDNGQYLIRSIYFETPDDKALREKIYGVSKREKFRIRYYNDDLSFIQLEKKMKHNNLCLKLETTLTEAEVRALLAGKLSWMLSHPSEIVRELYCKMKSQQLFPCVVVSYLREPYIYTPGNVRVTFDKEIRTSLYRRTFLEESASDVSATDTPGQIIMEVKYDEYMPDIITCLLQTEGVRQSAFSKYGVCRRFG